MANVKPTYINTSGGYTQPVDTATDSVSANAVYVQTSSTPDTNVGISRDVSNNLVLTDSVTGSKTLAQLAAGGGLTNWTEAVSTAAPNATVPVDSFTATNAATNVDAALVPKGNGASLAQIPDSGVNGGNKRGNYATDWQKYRTGNTEVASGSYATVSGGNSNTASGHSTTISGGNGNQATGQSGTVAGGQGNTALGGWAAIAGGRSNFTNNDYAGVGGGQSNQATGIASRVGGGNGNQAAGDYSAIGGGSDHRTPGQYATVSGGYGNQAQGLRAVVAGGYGNTAVGANSSICGGFQNSAQTGATVAGGSGNNASGAAGSILGGTSNVASANWATVGGGQNNVASTAHSTIGGGLGNAASGSDGATVGGGAANTASDFYSTVSGGANNLAQGYGATVPGGYNATTRATNGKLAYASNSVTRGATQLGILVTRGQTTTNTPLILSVAGNPADSVQLNRLPATSAYAVRCTVVARDNVGTTAAWEVSGLVKQDANAATTAVVGVPFVTSIGADAGAAAWTVALIAETTNGAAVIQVTDGTGTPTTVNWVATMYTTEIDL